MTWITKSVPKPEGRGKRPPHPLKRSKMKQRNAKRKGHMFPKNVDLGLREWIRAHPCILRGRPGHSCVSVVQVCHVKSRGAGGPDRNNVIPMCAMAHDTQHVIGIRAFEKWWNVNLKEIAHNLTELYEREHFPCP